MRLKILILTLMIFLLGLTTTYESTINAISLDNKPIISVKPTSILMYDLLVKYAVEYDIPINIALGIAKEETGYLGPFHWSYNPSQISSTGACGPMQILPSTATYIYGNLITKDQLLNNLDLNIEISMMYMAHLYNIYKKWDIALGYYNTGHPIVNNYAIRIINY